MPGTKVIKPKPVDTTRKTQERPKAAKEAQSELRVPAVRKSRASSCPRNPQPERCQRPTGGPQGSPSKPGSERRTRSTSTAPKPPQNVCVSCSSNKAFTVIPPNPKKRREIQKKAEAELAALEELRLSRAMAYVSINPSSVGGCMSLEEVRSKQQQEMMLAKKKQKPV
uniref:Uncharacterized LOC101485622 n=1 Tax=Maylandia zebra TaxID=106582 RepID=A0A3P9C6B0_9CICH